MVVGCCVLFISCCFIVFDCCLLVGRVLQIACWGSLFDVYGLMFVVCCLLLVVV